MVFISTTRFGLALSCRQALNKTSGNEQVAVLPDASVAVQVTVVVPTGKIEPDGGLQATLTAQPFGSVADGRANVTAPLVRGGQVGAVTAVTLAGQEMKPGACVSCTVTMNEHVAPPGSEQVTVVVPIGKKKPEGGLQVTGPQSPVVMGGG
jgi:hypothetical protein